MSCTLLSLCQPAVMAYIKLWRVSGSHAKWIATGIKCVLWRWGAPGFLKPHRHQSCSLSLSTLLLNSDPFLRWRSHLLWFIWVEQSANQGPRFNQILVKYTLTSLHWNSMNFTATASRNPRCTFVCGQILSFIRAQDKVLLTINLLM